jgi:putative FmdB family regulatory protein
MPTYEFRCPNGHTFEQFHRISDAPSTATCPTCQAEAERAISGGAGLVFKGSGFYLTDYGKNAHRTSGPASSSGSSGESKAGEGGAAKSDAGGGGSSGSSSGSASGGASGGAASGGSSSSTSGGSSAKSGGE